MMGFKHALMGNRNNATYASSDAGIVSNKSASTDNTVTVTARIKL